MEIYYKGCNYVVGRRYIVDLRDISIEEIIGQERTTITLSYLMSGGVEMFVAPTGYNLDDVLESIRWKFPSWYIRQVKW